MEIRQTEQVKRLIALHNGGPKDPGRREFLGGLAAVVTSLVGGGALLKVAIDTLKEPEYEIIGYNGRKYVAIEGFDSFFEYGLRAPEKREEGYIAMRLREGIGGKKEKGRARRASCHRAGFFIPPSGGD